MTGDDREEFVRVVEDGHLGLAEEAVAPPADLSTRIRDRVTRRRRRGAFRLSVAALACAAVAVPISWSATAGPSKAAAGEPSKAPADPVAQASPTPAVSSRPEATPWWPLTDDRFTRIHSTAALTDLWDTRTGRHHTDVRASATIPFGNKSLILLVGHDSNGTSRIGLMAGSVLPDGTVSSKDAEFFTEQTVTSPSAPIAIAAYPLSDNRSMSTIALVAPPCPDSWRLTTGKLDGDDTHAGFREDAQGDLILTKMVPTQSFVTARCGTQTFRYGPDRAAVATSGTVRFELLTQR
jgi:hypothetical protein